MEATGRVIVCWAVASSQIYRGDYTGKKNDPKQTLRRFLPDLLISIFAFDVSGPKLLSHSKSVAHGS